MNGAATAAANAAAAAAGADAHVAAAVADGKAAAAEAAASPITVIVCTWNRAATLAQTLQSLAAQQRPAAAVEVIVVDNNSSDDTRAVVEQAAAGWPFGVLRYAFEPRQGKQHALNHGVALASHALLAFTDDDILFPADWLATVGRTFAEPSVELAGGRTLIRWSAAGRPDWYADEMLAILAGVDLGAARLDPAPRDYAPGGSNLIARRRLFDRVGGYSPTHFRHMDHEFGIRCQRAGVHVVYNPALVVWAPVDDACLTRRYFRRWSFKAGIARDDAVPDAAAGGRVAGLPRLPRWLYRQVVEDALRVAWRAVVPGRRQHASTAFAVELRLWRGLGTLANAWHAWLRPAAHAGWIERYSQKKKNVY